MSPGTFVRNVFVNFVGQLLPPLVALAAFPVIVRQIGADGFGTLSLLWLFQAQVGLLDLGLGRATTKFTAEFLGSGRHPELPALFWSSLAFHGALGLMCGGVVALTAPLLVNHVFNVPRDMIPQSRLAFAIVGLGLPFTLLSGALRGTLEGFQSFVVTNAVRIVSRSGVFLMAAVLPALGIGLPGIAIGMVVLEIATCLTLLFFCFRLGLEFRKGFSGHRRMIRALAAFSGWIAISNVTGPLLFSIERFLIASLLNMSAVAYYVAPSQLVSRFFIVPASLMLTLFPLLSAMAGSSRSDRNEAMGDIYARSLKNMLFFLGTLLLPVTFFSHEILHFWMGAEFAKNGATVMQVLAIGVLVNSLARVPYDLLQAVGRVSFTARLHLIQLPPYLVVCWLFVMKFGILGAAAAFSLRVLVEAIVLFIAVNRYCPSTRLSYSGSKLLESACVFFGIFILPILTTPLLPGALVVRVPVLATGVGVLGFALWRNVLTADERAYLKGLFFYAVPQRTR